MAQLLHRPAPDTEPDAPAAGAGAPGGDRWPWQLVAAIGLVAVVGGMCSAGPGIEDDSSPGPAAAFPSAAGLSAPAHGGSGPVPWTPNATTPGGPSAASAASSDRPPPPTASLPFGVDGQPLADGVSVVVTSARRDGPNLVITVRARNTGTASFSWTSRVRVSVPLTTGGYVTCSPVGPSAGGPRLVVVGPSQTEDVPVQCATRGLNSPTVTVSVSLYGGDPIRFSGPID